MNRSYTDDITLMAYADSELNEKESKEVELALKGNEDAQARLKDFIITGATISVYKQILT